MRKRKSKLLSSKRKKVDFKVVPENQGRSLVGKQRKGKHPKQVKYIYTETCLKSVCKKIIPFHFQVFSSWAYLLLSSVEKLSRTSQDNHGNLLLASLWFCTVRVCKQVSIVNGGQHDKLVSNLKKAFLCIIRKVPQILWTTFGKYSVHFYKFNLLIKVALFFSAFVIEICYVNLVPQND